jgi:hypothetical protein
MTNAADPIQGANAPDWRRLGKAGVKACAGSKLRFYSNLRQCFFDTTVCAVDNERQGYIVKHPDTKKSTLMKLQDQEKYPRVFPILHVREGSELEDLYRSAGGEGSARGHLKSDGTLLFLQPGHFYEVSIEGANQIIEVEALELIDGVLTVRGTRVFR